MTSKKSKAVIPAYRSRSVVYYIDHRAKRIVQARVINSCVRYEPSFSDDNQKVVSENATVYYTVQMNAGLFEIEQEKLFPNLHLCSIAYGKIYVEKLD